MENIYKSLRPSSKAQSLELNELGQINAKPLQDDNNDNEENGAIISSNINNIDISGNSGYHQVAKIGDPIIRLRNIHKTYLLGLEGVPALRGVSLTIHEGEFIVILGKSGGGKTSMLNIMGTIDKPTKGDLYIHGKRISSHTTDTEVAEIRLKKIGFCFQTFNLISSMTALENVELPLILDGRLSSSSIKKRSKELLDHMGLSNRYSHLPSQLSGGEQQRVTIARAIANKPKVLLLDEPTGDLDTKNSNIVLDVLLNLNRKNGITCVFVTHDVSLKYFAHRCIHMLDGKISKIENISLKKRKIAERELKNSLNQGKPEKIIQQTEIREPSNFYSYHNWVKNHPKFGQKIRKIEAIEKTQPIKQLNDNNIDIDDSDNDDNDNDNDDRKVMNDDIYDNDNNLVIETIKNEIQEEEITITNDDSNSHSGSKRKGEDSVIVDSSQSIGIGNGNGNDNSNENGNEPNNLDNDSGNNINNLLESDNNDKN